MTLYSDKPFPTEWSTEGGLYLIVAKINQKNIPEYIGITGRNFAVRMSEHMAIGKTAQQIKDRKEKPGVIVYTISLRLPVAKFFESVFLDAFDFPMNKEENGNRRFTYMTKGRAHSVKEGLNEFKTKYVLAFSEVESFEKTINSIFSG